MISLISHLAQLNNSVNIPKRPENVPKGHVGSYISLVSNNSQSRMSGRNELNSK